MFEREGGGRHPVRGARFRLRQQTSNAADHAADYRVDGRGETRADTAEARELARLRADVRRIKIVAAPVHHSLMGTPKLMAATGKFLDDEQRASLDNLTKNRLIDLAASAVAGSCDQCFQQLEAERPIVQIAHPAK